MTPVWGPSTGIGREIFLTASGAGEKSEIVKFREVQVEAEAQRELVACAAPARVPERKKFNDGDRKCRGGVGVRNCSATGREGETRGRGRGKKEMRGNRCQLRPRQRTTLDRARQTKAPGAGHEWDVGGRRSPISFEDQERVIREEEERQGIFLFTAGEEGVGALSQHRSSISKMVPGKGRISLRIHWTRSKAYETARPDGRHGGQERGRTSTEAISALQRKGAGKGSLFGPECIAKKEKGGTTSNRYSGSGEHRQPGAPENRKARPAKKGGGGEARAG